MRLDGIKAVLFDLDGTLYWQPAVRAAMAAELALATVRPTDGRRLVKSLRSYRRAHECLRREQSTGDIALRQLRRAADDAGVEVEWLRDVVTEWMHERPLKYLGFSRRPGVVPLLRALREQRLPLGVLSDYEPRRKLEAMGILGYFDLVLCTTDACIDALKPHPRGFLHACDRWGLAPAEVLYVGDRPDVDGAGALMAGLPCAIVGRGSGHMEGLHRVAGFGALGRALGRG